MPMPDLHRIDAVPVRDLSRRQEKIDGGGGGAAAIAALIAESLAEVPALRMRHELKQADHVGGGEPGHQDLFLRSRIAANTFQSGAYGMPRMARMAVTCGRRNGFVSSSRSSRVGSVGLFL